MKWMHIGQEYPHQSKHKDGNGLPNYPEVVVEAKLTYEDEFEADVVALVIDGVV